MSLVSKLRQRGSAESCHESMIQYEHRDTRRLRQTGTGSGWIRLSDPQRRFYCLRSLGL
ncbi:unnamed protein product [Boreogadus saida]